MLCFALLVLERRLSQARPGMALIPIVIGAGVAAVALGARWAMRNIGRTGGAGLVYYYKGGFEPKMTREEARLILGVS